MYPNANPQSLELLDQMTAAGTAPDALTLCYFIGGALALIVWSVGVLLFGGGRQQVPRPESARPPKGITNAPKVVTSFDPTDSSVRVRAAGSPLCDPHHARRRAG